MNLAIFKTMESFLLLSTSSSHCILVSKVNVRTIQSAVKWALMIYSFSLEFVIKRDPKWGGDKVYTSFEDVEKEFAEEVGGGRAFWVLYVIVSLCL